MGSGKSTVGPRVARALGWRFQDLDALIEARAGQPIPRLFETEGEAAFRRLEAEALRATGDEERLVVAVGGGALVGAAAMRWARRRGTVVYLRVPAGELARRLRAEAEGRPLLLGPDGQALPAAALRARIGDLLEKREAAYRRAHVVVEAGGQTVEETTDAVLKTVQAHWETHP